MAEWLRQHSAKVSMLVRFHLGTHVRVISGASYSGLIHCPVEADIWGSNPHAPAIFMKYLTHYPSKSQIKKAKISRIIFWINHLKKPNTGREHFMMRRISDRFGKATIHFGPLTSPTGKSFKLIMPEIPQPL